MLSMRSERHPLDRPLDRREGRLIVSPRAQPFESAEVLLMNEPRVALEQIAAHVTASGESFRRPPWRWLQER
jgi:hypothetical protein